MGKILLAGQSKRWGNLEQATEFWLRLGINHLMIKVSKDTPYIKNGEVVEKQFERYQRLQEKYGVKYHLHPYDLKTDGQLLDFSLEQCHSFLHEIFVELDKKIHQYNLYPLITVHPPKFNDPRYNLEINEEIALKNGIEFFERLGSMNLKSKIAIETIHDPYRNSGFALLGYRAGHFQEIIGDKNYGLCFDVGHLNLAKEPLEKFLELPYPIFSVHLHGNDGTGDKHQMATKSNVKNFEATKKMLKEVKGPVVIEIENHGYTPDDFKRLFELWELK